VLEDQIRANRRKSRLLFLGFFLVYALLAAAVSFAISGFEVRSNLVVFGVFVAVASVVIMLTLFMGDDMAVKIAGGRRIESRNQAPELWDAVETMAISAGVQMPRLYVSNDPSPNAFAAGRNQEQALICVNRGLLEQLDKEELEGVIAHEMAHIRNLDVRLMTYAAVLAGSLALLSEFIVRMFIWGGDDDAPGGAIGAVIAIFAALLAPVAAMIIQMAVSRRREFLADTTAAEMTKYPQGLSSALRQISDSRVEPRHARKAIAHLYIHSPAAFKGKKAGLFSTHPAMGERLDRLDRLANGQMHVHRPRARSQAMAKLLGGEATAG
jgi:heat shock protein HtpX